MIARSPESTVNFGKSLQRQRDKINKVAKLFAACTLGGSRSFQEIAAQREHATAINKAASISIGAGLCMAA